MAADAAPAGLRRPPGSAAKPYFVREDYLVRYEALLRQHLPARFAGFAPFFANLDRLDTLASMLHRHLSGVGKAILNAGSGVFATEIFVRSFQDQRVTSFDYTAEFAPFYAIFRAEGVLDGTSFMQADAMKVRFDPHCFDLIVMHDLLYEEALDLEALVSRYRAFLAPGGLIYFDYMNRGVRWLWSLLGREKRYRRYDSREVPAILRRLGFEIVEQRPVTPSGSAAKAALHRVLAGVFGTSNAFAVVARLRPGS